MAVVKKGKVKAKAVIPNAKELNEVITGKMRNCIHTQYNLMVTHMNRIYTGEEIKEMISHIKQKEANEEYIIPMKWYGMSFPLALLKMEHDTKVLIYNELVRKVDIYKKELKEFGMTDDEINNVLNGHYTKGIGEKNDLHKSHEGDEMNYVG